MGKIQEELKTYNKTVLDHFENPRNVGSLPNATHVVTGDNPHCQDIVKLAVIVKEKRITEVRVKIMGCTVAIASASVLSEMIKNRPLEDLVSFDAEQIIRSLGGLPDHKHRCTGAPLVALRKLLDQIR